MSEATIQKQHLTDSVDRAWIGLGFGEHPLVPRADVIVVIDCDVPWITSRCRPNESCRIFHLDVDPLKPMMNVFYIDAEARYQVDSAEAITQLNDYIVQRSSTGQVVVNHDDGQRAQEHQTKLSNIAAAAKLTDGAPVLTSAYVGSQVKQMCPPDTIWIIEAVTQTVAFADQLQVVNPLSWMNCGGGGLGWSGGGALGVKLALLGQGEDKFVCQIVGGESCFLFLSTIFHFFHSLQPANQPRNQTGRSSSPSPPPSPGSQPGTNSPS